MDAPHDEGGRAGADDEDVENAGRELHAALKDAHCPVVEPLGLPVELISPQEFTDLIVLVGEGPRYPDAGNAAFEAGVYAGRLALHFERGARKAEAAPGGEGDDEGNQDHENEGELPSDQQHGDGSPREGDDGDEKIPGP